MMVFVNTHFATAENTALPKSAVLTARDILLDNLHQYAMLTGINGSE